MMRRSKRKSKVDVFYYVQISRSLSTLMASSLVLLAFLLTRSTHALRSDRLRRAAMLSVYASAFLSIGAGILTEVVRLYKLKSSADTGRAVWMRRGLMRLGRSFR